MSRSLDQFVIAFGRFRGFRGVRGLVRDRHVGTDGVDHLLGGRAGVEGREVRWQLNDRTRVREPLEFLRAPNPGCRPKFRAHHDQGRTCGLQQNQRVRQVSSGERSVAGFLQQLAKIRQHIRRRVDAENARVHEGRILPPSGPVRFSDGLSLGFVRFEYRLQARDPQYLGNLGRHRTERQSAVRVSSAREVPHENPEPSAVYELHAGEVQDDVGVHRREIVQIPLEGSCLFSGDQPTRTRDDRHLPYRTALQRERHAIPP